MEDVLAANQKTILSEGQLLRFGPMATSSWRVINVIERRRGEVRFGPFHFKIVRGIELEAEFVPPPHHPPVIASKHAD